MYQCIKTDSAPTALFASSDVSKLIKDGAKDISPNLLAIARRVVGTKKKHGK
ncbi:hypothetical protein N9W11_06175 [Psychrosphaera haliotis]|uniref:hypothetical protein n=1 Tax=Psychrosphaera haliotis TaxID=555083 RepID=UPI002373BCA1|nr:hypothetical protein [Psychrosphaera haliotis]